MKLLVVEDDSDQLWLRCLLLNQNGFETLESGDSASALQLAAEHRPDAALVDLRIPTESAGLRLIRELKRVHSCMRVFVLTGVDPSRFDKCPEHEMVEEFIAKGSPSSYLISRLKS
jgi:two-component system response regulator RegA